MNRATSRVYYACILNAHRERERGTKGRTNAGESLADVQMRLYWADCRDDPQDVSVAANVSDTWAQAGQLNPQQAGD
jgi:hypothetical protein